MRLTLPQQYAEKSTAELATIARTTNNTQARQTAIRQLELRAVTPAVSEGPKTQSYAAQEIRGQLARGPHPEEDFFRLQVTGDGKSKWVNITPEQLRAIGEVLNEDKDQCRKALAELVRLKDGPRDDAYRASKDQAWEAARTALDEPTGDLPREDEPR